MKINYVKPLTEDLPLGIREEILAGSVDGSLATYGSEEDFVW